VTEPAPSCQNGSLVSPENAAALDKTASASWGLNPFALVEAAGRACASILKQQDLFFYNDDDNDHIGESAASSIAAGSIVVCAGPGNNGADALVMLRSLLMTGFPLREKKSSVDGKTEARAALPSVLLSRAPAAGENSPRSEAVRSLKAMGVPVVVWADEKNSEKKSMENGGDKAAALLQNAALIIDGISGTGIKGALEGIPLEMVIAINKRRAAVQDTTLNAACTCCVVSIDVPSGACNAWKPNMPIVTADYTLAIEPLKTVLYTPALRPHCGEIIPVNNIFPPQLLHGYEDAELLCWEEQRARIPPVPADAYKYVRGTVEIHAGSPGFAGAARLAAAGATSAGAGLVRLVVDDELYPVLAAASGGVMVVPASNAAESLGKKNAAESPTNDNVARFEPDALLLGPGWGRGGTRLAVLQQALEAERSGVPLVLDADGIALLKTLHPTMAAGNGVPQALPELFHNRAILTPHAGELEALSGIPRDQLLSNPALIAELAKKLNAVILFKSHVMIVAAPDGRLGFIDGMDPALGAGGSGDFLAGLCAAIAGRMRAAELRGTGLRGATKFDPYSAAAAAGTLLAAASRRMGRRFYDPLELAMPAAALAGEAWLPGKNRALKRKN